MALVPETLKFQLTGKLREGVYARDLILSIIGMIGANGANYMAMEFSGEGLKTLNISDRIAICNLCVEAGAKTALMEVDDITLDYLKAHSREPKHIFKSDEDAVFAKVYNIDLATIQPMWQSRTLSIMWSAQRSVWGRILMKPSLVPAIMGGLRI